MKNHLAKYWNLYISFILLIMGLFYIRRAYAYDEMIYHFEQNREYQHSLAIMHIDLHYQDALIYENCKTNADKYRFHKENAERCYKDAKNKCWILPDISDRDKARYCFTNIGVLLSPGELQSKLIIALITTLVQYGLDCCDEWHYINNKLYWSQYHYEMMEFYATLARQD